MAQQSHHFPDRIRTTLGQQEWLDRPSYRLEHGLTFLFAAVGRYRDRVSNALHGTWLGHPLHPALTSVPTGAVTTTVAMDAAGLLPGRTTQWRDASRFALGVGLVGSVGAGVTGLTDWQHTHERSRRIGLVHGVLNAVATGLYAMSWWDRRRDRHLRGMASSAVGYGITLGSGYLGGALVFGSATGVDRAGTRLSGGRWTPVLPATALDGQPQRVEVDGVGVVLYRNDDRVLAVGERCPHLGAPMGDGWIDRDRIVCPWHGSRFACESGQVLRGPATAPLPSYPARIRDGLVEVRGGEMNAYDVLFEHHKVLRGLCEKITAIPPDTDERQDALDELLIELDIHMRIEDDLFYPAVSAATELVAIAHAEHRQVWDQLAVLLRTPPTAPGYQDEWHSFVLVLDAHASEEERDLCPPPIDLDGDMLDALGNHMVERIARLRQSDVHKLRVRGRKALLSSL